MYVFIQNHQRIVMQEDSQFVLKHTIPMNQMMKENNW